MKCIRIGYLNVGFDLIIRTETDREIIGYLVKQIQQGKQYQMKDIAQWCSVHNIDFKTCFKYRKDFPLIANLWNLFSYVRFKVENI